MAEPLSLGGKTEVNMANAETAAMALPIPWITRPAISIEIPADMAEIKDPMV